jgi:hypothetical protein
MPKGKFTPFTAAQEAKIKDEYLQKPVKRLADETGASFGRIMHFLKRHNLEIPRHIIEQRKRDSQHKKGHIAFNKGKKQAEYMSPENIEKTKATRFKKGDRPANYVTGEFLTTDGYIKLSLQGSTQRLKHLYLWEKIHGPLPIGYCLACIDGDRLNCEPRNWELITRGENMLRNSHYKPSPQLIKTMALASKLKRTIKQLEENGK